MFTNPDFLSALAVGVGIGLVVLFWISRPFRSAMKGANQPDSSTNFWAAVIQLSSILVPVMSTLTSYHYATIGSREVAASTIVVAACLGALLVVIFASSIVGWATPQPNVFQFSASDSNELKQLLHRMREFRAHEIARSSELAEKSAER